MQQYKYNLGYTTEEESEFTQFFFDRKLTNKELADYVHQATANALRYAVKHKDQFYWGVNGKGPSFQELYPRVIEELKQFGFKLIEFDGKWRCFGWGSVCTNDWKGHTRLEDKLLRESISKDLRQQALQISKEENQKY